MTFTAVHILEVLIVLLTIKVMMLMHLAALTVGYVGTRIRSWLGTDSD
jgi:hypothetical protein